VRLLRRSPTRGLEFDLELPDGLRVYRDVAGTDLVVSDGALNDPAATVLNIGAVRDGVPVTLEEHVRRVRAGTAGLGPQLIDEGPVPVAGQEGWWTADALIDDGRALVVERWMLVRDGVGWTATVQMPWIVMHKVRDATIAVVSTLRFR
jgi:hypothetical protein